MSAIAWLLLTIGALALMWRLARRRRAANAATGATAEAERPARVRELLDRALRVMGEFPPGYVPAEPVADSPLVRSGFDVETVLREPAARERLQTIREGWPADLFRVFVKCSASLHELLGLGTLPEGDELDLVSLLGAGDARDLQLLRLIAETSESPEESGEAPGEAAPDLAFRAALVRELRRRSLSRRVPLANLLTTLLGPEALTWLRQPSQEGGGKLQPQEFSRAGWPNLRSIEHQLLIEQELFEAGREHDELAKLAVALAWTLAALAAFLEPEVFLAERDPHVSSLRDQGLTVSMGKPTQTLLAFEPDSVRFAATLARAALDEPLIDACDLMWMAWGVSRIRSIQSGHEPARPVEEPEFELFLSHRGRDAKAALAKAVLERDERPGLFLDCLSLPRGVVNRAFVFTSLARSKCIAIVDTPHFEESAWCKKERWLGQALADLGLAELESLPLEAALARTRQARPRVAATSAPAAKLSYPIARRVLQDLDGFGRAPNKYSLREAGHDTRVLEPLEACLEQASHQGASSVEAAAARVRECLGRVVDAAPRAEPLDLWASALQLALAILAGKSCARSKVEVRAGVDRLNAVLERATEQEILGAWTSSEEIADHLALLAAAAALDLCEFEPDPAATELIRAVVAEVAVLHEGLLLLDVRSDDATREPRLALVLCLVSCGIGSVGIVQAADDTVHETSIRGRTLAVLPCVTLHPGMEGWIAGLH